MGATVALVVNDLLARTRLEDAAKHEGWTVTRDVDTAELVVIDLDQPGAMARVEQLRTGDPAIPVVGFVSHVDAATREKAASMGVTVMTRGSAAAGVREIFRTIER